MDTRTGEIRHYTDAEYNAAIAAGTPLENRCSRCGEPADDGEGWDGLCGNCADSADGDAPQETDTPRESTAWMAGVTREQIRAITEDGEE